MKYIALIKTNSVEWLNIFLKEPFGLIQSSMLLDLVVLMVCFIAYFSASLLCLQTMLHFFENQAYDFYENQPDQDMSEAQCLVPRFYNMENQFWAVVWEIKGVGLIMSNLFGVFFSILHGQKKIFFDFFYSYFSPLL